MRRNFMRRNLMTVDEFKFFSNIIKMSSLEEQIIESVDELLGKIKNKYPETIRFINLEFIFYKKKLESLIPEAITQSVEMPSQVNIIYYIFFISRLG